MDEHDTHIISDETSSENCYKYNESGKLIIDNHDVQKKAEPKKYINKNENNLNNAKMSLINIGMDNYDQDFDNSVMGSMVKNRGNNKNKIINCFKMEESEKGKITFDLNNNFNSQNYNKNYYQENSNENYYNIINNGRQEKYNIKRNNINKEETIFFNKNYKENTILENEYNKKNNGKETIFIYSEIRKKKNLSNKNNENNNNEMTLIKKTMNSTFPNMSNRYTINKNYSKDLSSKKVSKEMEIRENIIKKINKNKQEEKTIKKGNNSEKILQKIKSGKKSNREMLIKNENDKMNSKEKINNFQNRKLLNNEKCTSKKDLRIKNCQNLNKSNCIEKIISMTIKKNNEINNKIKNLNLYPGYYKKEKNNIINQKNKNDINNKINNDNKIELFFTGLNIRKNKNLNNGIRVIPKAEKNFITKLIRINYDYKIIYPSLINNYYYCTKQLLSSGNKKKKGLPKNATNSNSRNINSLKSNIKNKKNNFLNNNKNKKRYIKIPKIDNLRKKTKFNSPITGKNNRNFFASKIEEENRNGTKKDNSLNVKYYKMGLKKHIIKDIKSLKNNKKMKSIRNLNEINCYSYKVKNTNTNYENKDNIKNYFKNNKNQKNEETYTNITSLNSESNKKQNMNYFLSKIERMKLMKKKILVKKDNNLLVVMKGFKKHYGIEENCPICVKRIYDVKKNLQTPKQFNYCFNSTFYNGFKKNIGLDDLEKNRGNSTFYKNKLKKNVDENSLFKNFSFQRGKNTKDDHSNSSLSPILINDKKGNKTIFPIIYNYFDF